MDIKNYLLDVYIAQNGYNFTPELAKCIVEDFPVTDESNRENGEKWTLEETTAAASSLGIKFDTFSKLDWYVVLNNEYSDKYSIVRKYSLPEPSIYFDFALSWFNDIDAKKDKTFKYFIS